MERLLAPFDWAAGVLQTRLFIVVGGGLTKQELHTGLYEYGSNGGTRLFRASAMVFASKTPVARQHMQV